nr:immunoglobulin heavy chain junction region [Mus musculus]MBK4186673.1 immunoglobulin heavy chain junction region [Mus musculus]
CSRWDYDVGYW